MNATTLRSLRIPAPFSHCLQKHCLRDSNWPTASPLNAILQPLLQCQARNASTSTSLGPSGEITSKVDGPKTTLPAPLITPIREPSQSAPSFYFALGKSYANFYKTGLKHVYHNFIASRALQERIDKDHSSSLISAASSGALTRSEFQLLVRNQHDIKRVPIFALVVLVCGEFTPLVVVAFSGVVPWTCRIPKQIYSDRRKMEDRRSVSFRNLTTELPTEKGVGKLERMQLLHISWSLGLSSRIWDYLGGKLPGLPTWILRRRVEARIDYLDQDDKLILQNGGVKEMNIEEIRLALVERGVDVLERRDADLRADLTLWMRSRNIVPTETLLLTRSRVWPNKTMQA